MFLGKQTLINLAFLMVGIGLGIGGLKIKQATQSQLPPTPIVGPGAVQYDIEVDRQVARSQLTDGAALFFGDSHTVALATSTVTARGENFGISSDTLDGLSTRLPRYKIDKACAVILEIGTNNIQKEADNGFARKYGRLFDHIPTTTPIIAVAIFPFLDPQYSAAVHTANLSIASACRSRPNCRVLDISDRLKADGQLDDRNYDSDRIHLSSRGTALWVEALKASIPNCR